MRKPIYHKDSQPYRVISVANGLWVAQKYDGSGGTREHDPWHNLHAPTSKAEAMRIMYERCPPQP